MRVAFGIKNLLKPLGVGPRAIAWAKDGEELATIQQLSKALSYHDYKDEEIMGIH